MLPDGVGLHDPAARLHVQLHSPVRHGRTTAKGPGGPGRCATGTAEEEGKGRRAGRLGAVLQAQLREGHLRHQLPVHGGSHDHRLHVEGAGAELLFRGIPVRDHERMLRCRNGNVRTDDGGHECHRILHGIVRRCHQQPEFPVQPVRYLGSHPVFGIAHDPAAVSVIVPRCHHLRPIATDAVRRVRCHDHVEGMQLRAQQPHKGDAVPAHESGRQVQGEVMDRHLWRARQQGVGQRRHERVLVFDIRPDREREFGGDVRCQFPDLERTLHGQTV
mmetsp:Transcript_19846/g.56118  ORF Transcript_19846/g.56118 Transcript_19846/m.56118 type:complete len:274 (+) Transcript_19846:1122-1943(+)